MQRFQEENTLIANLTVNLTANMTANSTANLTANSTANIQSLSAIPMTSAAQSSVIRCEEPREDLSEYVAHLQLHMALQARNLVPTLTQAIDSRQQMLQQTQADFEKYVSRQSTQVWS